MSDDKELKTDDKNLTQEQNSNTYQAPQSCSPEVDLPLVEQHAATLKGRPIEKEIDLNELFPDSEIKETSTTSQYGTTHYRIITFIDQSEYQKNEDYYATQYLDEINFKK